MKTRFARPENPCHSQPQKTFSVGEAGSHPMKHQKLHPGPERNGKRWQTYRSPGSQVQWLWIPCAITIFNLDTGRSGSCTFPIPATNVGLLPIPLFLTCADTLAVADELRLIAIPAGFSNPQGLLRHWESRHQRIVCFLLLCQCVCACGMPRAIALP